MVTRDTQARIVRSAIDLFNTHGTAAISTNRIAEMSGVSSGNLHYHFRNKHEIIHVIFEHMVEEMDDGWYQDHLNPTAAHLAEMFARQIVLIHDYRFFYREMTALLRDDPVLLRRYRENRSRRVAALEHFFMELDKAKVLRLNADRALIRTLIDGTWIICDNWLNSIELLGLEITLDSIQSGFHLVLGMFRPYMALDETVVLCDARKAISLHCGIRGMYLAPTGS